MNLQKEEPVEELLSQPTLLKRMLLADGAKRGKYGQAYRIYKSILAERVPPSNTNQDPTGVWDRPALAISLEHAEPLAQENPRQSDTLTEPFVNLIDVISITKLPFCKVNWILPLKPYPCGNFKVCC
jgi:hypothetical protein